MDRPYNIPILFENQEILVVNKPAGVLVHPSGKPGQFNVVDYLRQTKNDPEIRPVHRLDRLTSGVLLLAKSAEAARFYGDLFANQLVKKSYLAEVRGQLTSPSGTLSKDLGKDINSAVAIRRKTVLEGESAITHFQCLVASEHSSFLMLRPTTGRRHQLRVHLADITHPIINDPIYDLGDEYYLALRGSNTVAAPMHLHALELAIPIATSVQTFSTPLPAFAMRYLESYSKVARNCNDSYTRAVQFVRLPHGEGLASTDTPKPVFRY